MGKRLDEIIDATLSLASEVGLGNVSLQMIADKVGIRKSSLFNHISSKDDLISKMYHSLREKAKAVTNYPSIDFNRDAFDILYDSYNMYLESCSNPKLNMFYRLIYSERAFSNIAREVVIEETERSINRIKWLLNELVKREKLYIDNIDIVAVEYGFTLHNFIDYVMDTRYLNIEMKYDVKEYIHHFVENNQKGVKCGNK